MVPTPPRSDRLPLHLVQLLQFPGQVRLQLAPLVFERHITSIEESDSSSPDRLSRRTDRRGLMDRREKTGSVVTRSAVTFRRCDRHKAWQIPILGSQSVGHPSSQRRPHE